ncbi:MAG: EAL domain-containing protein [Desulfobacteraceae bacterium]|jgi:diguanylate cyclase (GGDEF)-like protein
MIIGNEYIWRALDELETNALLFVDTTGIIRDINNGVTRLFGYAAHEIVGEPVELLITSKAGEVHRSFFKGYIDARKKEMQSKSPIIGAQRNFPEIISVQGAQEIQFSAVDREGKEIPITLTINEVCSDTDEILGFIAIMQDNTEQYNLHQTLKHQLSFDKLTGLMNWQEFLSQVRKFRKDAGDNGKKLLASIIFIDIDYFRTITFQSSSSGDYAIKKVSAWLLDRVRQKKGRQKDLLVSYFIGDEFILFLPDTGLDGALTVANRLRNEFQQLNLRTVEQPFYSSISVGISILDESVSLQEAFSRASNACRIAKEKGKGKVKIAKDEYSDYFKMEPVIREAIRDHRIELYAQKIVPLSAEAKSEDDGKDHYEILSRLKDKEGNIISPVIFITAAEKLGRAVEIDKYVIEQTFNSLTCHREYLKQLSMCSINLSGAAVSNESMFRFIDEQILNSGIDPYKLCFEITETYEIQDNDIAYKLVSRLRDRGCKIAFDDFGIGYSNYQSFSNTTATYLRITFAPS